MKLSMKKACTSLMCMCLSAAPVWAADYYVATNGDDTHAGTLGKPFATLTKALSLAEAGDNIYIRGGNYKVTEDWIMDRSGNKTYAKVFDIKQSGSESKPIRVWGYEGERPVFDLSEVRLTDRRVAVFYVSGHYWHFKNFEVVGTQVAIKGHTQSEAFRMEGGNSNVYENIAVHDGMAIGFYLVKGMNNLVLNCDAYDNYDGYSEEDSGNVDGFGGHSSKETSTGNVFRGCRAWNNGDDGFDLINCMASFVIENCWSFTNGYKPNSMTPSGGNGAGFKSGGYGMSDSPKVPDPMPQHIVRNSLAYNNRQQGFYANHHLGGLLFESNTGYQNPSNFNMVNRKSAAEAVDVPGYGHVVKNNLSLEPRSKNPDNTPAHLTNVSYSTSEIVNNSFAPKDMGLQASDFVSLDDSELKAPRKADGSLPDINFLRLTEVGTYKFWGMGCFADDNAIDYSWMQVAAIVIEGETARVAGSGAEAFVRFFVNGEEVEMNAGRVDLSSYNGKLRLKAVAEDGTVTTLTITK